jgi:predicted signal transduction protein with EAL and GGDEF domain
MRAQVTTSIGITTFDGREPATAEDLLVEADIAMYDAKAAGKDRARLCQGDSERRAMIASRQGWLARLRDAVAQERLTLFAQPITPVCAGTANWFELLIRMRGDDDELIMPGTFLYNAERFGLIQSIDRWVVGQAIELLHAYSARGVELLGKYGVGYSQGYHTGRPGPLGRVLPCAGGC